MRSLRAFRRGQYLMGNVITSIVQCCWNSCLSNASNDLSEFSGVEHDISSFLRLQQIYVQFFNEDTADENLEVEKL